MARRPASELKIDLFLKALEKSGDELDACIQAKVSQSSINKWKKQDPQLQERIDQALLVHVSENRANLRAIVSRRFARLALGQEKRTKKTVKYTYGPLGEWQRGEETGEILYDESTGEPLRNIPAETVINETEETILTPQWVYERVLGRGEVSEAIATLIDMDVYDDITAADITKVMDSTTEELRQVLTRHALPESDH